LETSAEIFSAASAKREVELQPTIVQDEIVEEERDVAMLLSVIRVSLQGSNVFASLDSIETDPGIAPLHSYLVTTNDEIVVDALLAQPLSEANI